MRYRSRQRNIFALPAILLILAALGFFLPVLFSWLLGLFAALFVVAAIMIPVILLGVAGIRFMRSPSEKFSRPLNRERPISEAEQAAMAGMHRAGRERKYTQLQLIDIGLLVYEGTTHPRIFRLADVPSSATHIRPYIVLYQPVMPNSSGHGGVRLDLRDHDGTLRYTSDETYTLKPGKNFITPPTWLPLHNQPTEDGWTLEVRVGDTLIGVHTINWLQIGGATRAQFNDEGEIDPRARRWKELDFDEPLSLEDLLAEQEHEARRASQV